MKKKLLLFAGFFVVLLTVFYFLLFSGTDYYKSKLPVLNYVQDFSFTGQDGNAVNQHNVAGKVYVTEYFLLHAKVFAQR